MGAAGRDGGAGTGGVGVAEGSDAGVVEAVDAVDVGGTAALAGRGRRDPAPGIQAHLLQGSTSCRSPQNFRGGVCLRSNIIPWSLSRYIQGASKVVVIHRPDSELTPPHRQVPPPVIRERVWKLRTQSCPSLDAGVTHLVREWMEPGFGAGHGGRGEMAGEDGGSADELLGREVYGEVGRRWRRMEEVPAAPSLARQTLTASKATPTIRSTTCHVPIVLS